MLDRIVSSLNALTMGTVTAVNAVSSQPLAIVVLGVGCVMLVFSKHYGIDATVSGGIVGVASDVLTGSLTRTQTQTDGKTKQTVEPAALPPTEERHA